MIWGKSFVSKLKCNTTWIIYSVYTMHQLYTPIRPTAIPNFAKICVYELNEACIQKLLQKSKSFSSSSCYNSEFHRNSPNELNEAYLPKSLQWSFNDAANFLWVEWTSRRVLVLVRGWAIRLSEYSSQILWWKGEARQAFNRSQISIICSK